MECENILDVKIYLQRFNNILCEMSNKMLSASVTDNITLDFIRCMIPHHQAAIYMCENLLEYTTYTKLQEIAKSIIKMQTIGINQMEEISKTSSNFLNFPSDVCSYISTYRIITQNMLNRMNNSPKCNNINLNFVNEMLPHHEGAIAMCNNLLQYYIDPRLKCVAENIIIEQSEGINKLKLIQKNLCITK